MSSIRPTGGTPITSPINEPKTAQSKDEIRQASELYEEQFLREMVRAMRKTVPESEFLKPGMGEKLYRDQLDDQYVENWTANGGMGLADLVEQQLRELQAQGRGKE